VDQIEHKVAELKDKGARFDDDPHLIAKMPDHELWMAFFKDPDRHQLALMEERR
jgi:methylmalonyl-CoA/ethylmalonyl-CoA epimerase